MSTAPFTPGPEGSVLDDQEVRLSGAVELDPGELGFNLRRGQVVEITIRGVVGKYGEVDKSVSGGREVTVGQWGVKATGLVGLDKVADPPPRKTGDGQVPGQMDISDAGAPGGLSEADEKARADVVPAPEGEELAKRQAEMAAHEASSREAVQGQAPPSTLAGDAAAQAADGDPTPVYVLPNREGLYHGQRWMTPEGKEFVVQSAGKSGDDDVIVGFYKDSGAQDAFPPQCFGSSLARMDIIEAAAPAPAAAEPHDPGTAGPATSPDEVKEHLS